MSFVAPAVRWPDAVASHLPQPLKDSGVPPQYFVLVPATLLAVLLTYTLTRASSKATPVLVGSGISDEAYTARRSRNRPSTVVLVGLSETGKTSLFSSLVYQTTPATLPSQKLSQGVVSSSVLDEALKPVTLVDLPGHARLRPLVDEHLSQADGIVICVDAVMASKASMTARAGEAETITDVADLIHATLTSLAKQRGRAASRAAPPSVLVLFTRADLSPLLGGAGAGTDAAKDDKRRAQLLARCRTALETELGQRRANMGLGRRSARSVKIAGLGKVAEADTAGAGSAGGVFGWIKSRLGLGGARGNDVSAEAEEEDDEHDDEVVDYIDWAAAQRALEANGTGIGAASFSLDRLDDQVVFAGKVDVALASVGKARAWDAPETPESTVQPATAGLADFKSWIAELQS